MTCPCVAFPTNVWNGIVPIPERGNHGDGPSGAESPNCLSLEGLRSLSGGDLCHSSTRASCQVVSQGRERRELTPVSLDRPPSQWPLSLFCFLPSICERTYPNMAGRRPRLASTRERLGSNLSPTQSKSHVAQHSGQSHETARIHGLRDLRSEFAMIVDDSHFTEVSSLNICFSSYTVCHFFSVGVTVKMRCLPWPAQYRSQTVLASTSNMRFKATFHKQVKPFRPKVQVFWGMVLFPVETSATLQHATPESHFPKTGTTRAPRNGRPPRGPSNRSVPKQGRTLAKARLDT